MSDQLRSWLRTVVPAAWSALIAWAVAAGLPESVAAPLGDASETVVVPVVLAAVYALMRWAEPHLPPWATRVLLGSNKPPSYPPPPSGQQQT